MILRSLIFRVSIFAYSIALLLLPESFRSDFEEELVACFRDLLADAYTRHGPGRAIATAFAAIYDMIWSAAREHIDLLMSRGNKSENHGPYTPKVGIALRLADQEATLVCESQCNEGHIVLGLLRERNGVAAQVMRTLGVDVNQLRDRVALLTEASDLSERQNDRQDRKSEVLSLAQEQSSNLGHDFVGTEHILLGVLTANSSIARDALQHLGVGADRLRTAILSAIKYRHAPQRLSRIELRRARWQRAFKCAVVTVVIISVTLSVALFAQTVPSKKDSPTDVGGSYKYRSDNIQIPLKDGKDFTCTLIRPESDRAVPAILMIPGYIPGYHNRSEDVARGAGAEDGGTVLGRYLAAQGIAVLQVPIGGGESGHDPSISADQLADRAVQCVTYLKGRSEIDPKHVGILGQSIGGFIAMKAAERESDVAFLITLATPVESIDDAFLNVLEKLMRDNNAPETERIKLKQKMETVFSAAKRGATSEEVRPMIEDFLRSEYAFFNEGQRKMAGNNADEFVKRILEDHVQDTVSLMFRSLIGYDVSVSLSKIACPKLILFAERDIKVEPKRSSEIAKKALTKSGSKNFTVEIIKGADHFFEARAGDVGTSNGGTEQRFAPGFLELLLKWLLQYS